MDLKSPDEMIKRIGGYLHRVVPIVDITARLLGTALRHSD